MHSSFECCLVGPLLVAIDGVLSRRNDTKGATRSVKIPRVRIKVKILSLNRILSASDSELGPTSVSMEIIKDMRGGYVDGHLPCRLQDQNYR